MFILKKHLHLLVIAIIQFIFISGITAQTPYAEFEQEQYEKKADIQQMINNGLEKNSDKISTIAKDLTPDQRENLFYKNKKNPGTAFLLNLLPGFGVGSFYQGDKVGGTLACFGDLIGLSFYYAASYNMDNSSNSDLTGVLFYLGFGILSFSRIFELIRPWVYSNDYNRKLEDSLRVAVRFMPYIHLVKVSDINGIAEGEDSVYGALLTAYF